MAAVPTETQIVGRVLRASTRGFACGTHSVRIDEKHTFGAFVKTPVANEPLINVIGLIYSVEIKDDQLVSELVMADNVNGNVLRDQRENRMVPVEISVLNVGYMTNGTIVQSLPPRPPMSLSEVYLCSEGEVFYFTQQYEFFRLILNAPEVASDDLLASCLQYASFAYPPEEQYEFRVKCGRNLARLLSNDLKRLSYILALIKP
jgi:hypothetical protein